MANWAAYKEQEIGLPVFKRAKHGLHFKRPDGQIQAEFVGKPCHYLDAGLWKPIDTKLLLMPDGFYGCPHSPVRVHKDGHVKVDGTDYQQYTELPSATGLVDGDRIVRTFSFGEQRMWVTENGYRSEITLNRVPTLQEARKVITSESGTLSKKYLKSLTTATDSNGDVHTVTTLSAFRTWLASAKFPVILDPDFAASTADYYTTGENAAYATARSTGTYGRDNGTVENLGQTKGTNFGVYRIGSKFDTSTIGAGATVTQVNLKFTPTTLDRTDTDFDVQIAKTDWSSLDPFAYGTRDASFDILLTGDLDDSIWCNTADLTVNTQYTSGNLSTTWVSKTGTTYYALRSKRDSDATEPTGEEYVVIAMANHATESYRPVLTVTYTAGGATGNPLMHRWRRI